MPRLQPQDARVGGSAAVREGGSAPATQGTMFGAKDATAEFRIKVSSQMSLEYADAQLWKEHRPPQCRGRFIYIFTYTIFGNVNFIT